MSTGWSLQPSVENDPLAGIEGLVVGSVIGDELLQSSCVHGKHQRVVAFPCWNCQLVPAPLHLQPLVVERHHRKCIAQSADLVNAVQIQVVVLLLAVGGIKIEELITVNLSPTVRRTMSCDRLRSGNRQPFGWSALLTPRGKSFLRRSATASVCSPPPAATKLRAATCQGPTGCRLR